MLKAVLTVLIVFILGAMIITPFGPARVVSESMEPGIRAGSTIFLTPASEFVPGEVMVFHPEELDREMIVHRVVDTAPEGYITRGDAVPRTDQERGEPPIPPERVAAGVLTLDGSVVQVSYELFIYLITGFCLLMGFYWVVSDRAARVKRLRVMHVQWLALLFCSILVVFTMIMGSGAQTISYLATDSPGARADHVRVGEPGEIEFRGNNRSLVPVLVCIDGPTGETVQLVFPFSGFETTMEVPAREESGWYEVNVNKYTYPVTLPPPFIDLVHQQSPYLAALAVIAATTGIIYLVLRLVEPWIPLSMLGGKALSRQYRLIKRSLLP